MESRGKRLMRAIKEGKREVSEPGAVLKVHVYDIPPDLMPQIPSECVKPFHEAMERAVAHYQHKEQRRWYKPWTW